jgi:muramoyltetrapeptide carboxypeptidase
MHLLDTLARMAAPAPYLIGYSDLSVFHAWWWVQGWGETCYGFMPAASCGSRSLHSTATLVAGQELTLDHHGDPAVRCIRAGQAMGTCFASCVRVLTGLCGTPAQPQLDGCILALEDIDERVYQLDRDFEQLHRAGVFTGIRGLVLGSFRAKEPEGYAGLSLVDLAKMWAERLQVPVILGLPFGHEDDPVSLACGRPTTLSVKESGEWSLVQAKAERPPLRS